VLENFDRGNVALVLCDDAAQTMQNAQSRFDVNQQPDVVRAHDSVTADMAFSSVRRFRGSPITMRWSPPEITVSAGGLKTMRPSPFRMARTITPRSRRILVCSSERETYSLDSGTRTCSMITSSPILLVAT